MYAHEMKKLIYYDCKYRIKVVMKAKTDIVANIAVSLRPFNKGQYQVLLPT